MNKHSFTLAGLAIAAGLLPAAVGRAGPGDEVLVGISMPSKVAAIAPEQAGKIVSIPVVDGTRVLIDDVLFRLNSRLEELDVARLKDLAESDLPQLRAAAALRFAEMQEARVRELRRKDISSDSDLQSHAFEVELAQLKVQQAALERKQAQNELSKAEERLAQRTVRSPFAGIVTQRWRSEGEAVEKFVPVIEVMSLDPLWIEFDCPIQDRNVFRVGSKILVCPAHDQTDVRTATVSFVSVKAAAASHTFMIRAAVDNKELTWKSGQKMTIQRPAAPVPGK